MRLNPYRIMWILVMFDLPVLEEKQRKAAAKFRSDLKKDGYGMWQYSVYARFCGSREDMAVHIKRLRSFLPPEGHVVVLHITDKQYGMIEQFDCRIEYLQRRKKPPKKVPKKPQNPNQLMMFVDEEEV